MRPTPSILTMAILAAVPALMLASPAAAATKEQKTEICKFGADNDKLEGKKRADFIRKCMSNANYEPAARVDAMKKPAAKKPAAAMAPAEDPK